MGWNTTVLVYNDALSEIKSDKEFGAKLAAAISGMPAARQQGMRVDVPSGSHANAAMVVETHHADNTAIVTVGGNLGICHHSSHGWQHHTREGQEKLLREWAHKLGFVLTPLKTA